MTAAQILATAPHLTQADLEDFASFMTPAQAERFWAEVTTHRS